jgi:hypothetical protein
MAMPPNLFPPRPASVGDVLKKKRFGRDMRDAVLRLEPEIVFLMD